MFENKLIEVKEMFGDYSEKYKSADTLELIILTLRENGFAYGSIQRWLGNPSKKIIRNVLLKYNPNLINICEKK